MEWAEAVTWLAALAAAYVVWWKLLGSLLRQPWKQLPPGPRGLPIVGCLPLLGAAPHAALTQLARRYGPVMYLKLGTSGIVVATSPGAAKAFGKTLDANFCSRPQDSATANILGYSCRSMVWASYGPRWAHLRKLCNLHVLGPKVEQLLAVRAVEVRALVRNIFRHARDGPLCLPEFLNICTANILGQLVLGRRVFEQEGGKANEFKTMVVELMTLSGAFNLADFIPQIAWMDVQGIQRKMKAIHKRWDALISDFIAEHKGYKKTNQNKQQQQQQDFVDILIQEGVDERDIKALILDLFAAGTDTSSSVTEWVMAELIDNPKIMAKLQSEIDRVVGRDKVLQQADVARLPYLQAVCKEGLRKHPPTPLGLPRIAEEACEVGGYFIPKNTRLLINIWGMLKDPAVWPNPEIFDPERFVGSNLSPFGNDFELIPFGTGRRICAGARMGLNSVEFMVGSLVQAFDWDVANPADRPINMDEAFGLTLQKAVPLVAVPTPRLSANKYQI